MWHGGPAWGNDDDDDDVEFQDKTSKRKSCEIIEIPDSSDENASSSEDEDVRRAAAVKPSPAKKSKKKVSLPKCAATKAPTDLPPRVDCVAPPGLMLPRQGPCLVLPEDRTTGDNLMWPSTTPTPYLGGGIYEAATKTKPVKKARKVISRIARLLGTKSFDVRVDDGAALRACCAGWRPYGKFGTLDGAICLDRLLKTNVLVAHDESAEFVEALAGLNDRDNDFKERCVHAVCFIDSKQLAAASKPLGKKKACRVHIAVWARRALFGLSAHPSTKIVLDAIAPAGERVPCRTPLAEDGTFSRSDPPLSSFTIKALLRDAESSGVEVPEVFDGSIEGLLADGIHLRPYQVQNVFWALHQEDRTASKTTSVAGLNGYYWERRAFVDGGDFYYFPHGGHVPVWKSKFRRPTRSMRCCLHNCVCSMAWRFTKVFAIVLRIT